MSYTWNYSPPPPPSSWPPKKLKRKMNTKATTSYLLPRLDDMVLLKPIATPCEDRDDFKEPVLAVEKTRTATISQHLDRYNRWLAFADASASDKKTRSTALELQETVHDINDTIGRMMMEIDRKILELHDRTDAFVEAVQEGDLWRSNGNILGKIEDYR
jgi:hypothetical protein